MPYPGNSPGSYVTSVGNKHIYSTSGGQYRLEVTIDGDSLVVTIDSTAPASAWNKVSGPLAMTTGVWRRVDLSQYGMHKGHNYNQKGTYLTQQDLWAWSFWRPEVSQGTLWSFQQAAYNNNSGSNNALLAPQMLYHADTAGQRQPLYEQIEIRVDGSLWDAVATFPSTRISPWASQLADTVLIDSWSHDSAAELTHLLLTLQHHFALEPVATIEYETSGQGPGSWHTLESLVENQGFVMITNNGRLPQSPWTPKPQSPEFDRIRVTYDNGLTVVVNRGSTDFTLNVAGQSLTLPPSGWVIWGTPAGSTVLAYSAYAPGTSHRIDFLEDLGAGVRYIDPRGGAHLGVDQPTQWVWKNNDWRRRLEADFSSDRPSVILEGQRLPLEPARQAASATLATDFSQGLSGWRTIRGAREATITGAGLELDLTAKAGFLHSPRLALAGATGDRIEVDLRFDQPTSGSTRLALLFQRPQDVAFHGNRKVEVNAAITGGWQTLSIPVGNHANWAGSTITRLRLDPAKANLPAPPSQVTLGAVRWVPAP